MVSNWQLRTIGECASTEPYSTQIGPFGEKIRAQNYTLTGAPVLRGTNVNPEGRFHDDDFVFIDPALAESEFNKFVCEADDVILCHKGTLGKIGVIPKKSRFKKYIMGNSMMKVRCDRSKLEPLYLYYWLCSREGQQYLFSRVSQVGVPQIQRPLTTLREATLPVPPLPEQKAIAAVLGALDDKIELNRRMNATLEAMAQALFQNWFVDFEPVRAKLDGRQPSGLDPATTALFPNKFEDSELGPIPKGWRVGQVSEMCNTQYGYTASATDKPVGPHFLRVMDINKNQWINWSSVPHCVIPDEDKARYALSVGDIVVARMADPGKSAIVEQRIDAVFASYLVRLKTESLAHAYYLYYYLKSSAYTDYSAGAMSGSVQANMNAKVIVAAELLMPPVSLMRGFVERILPLRQRIVRSLNESRTLAALRDTLLPKLLSGEIKLQNNTQLQ